MGEGLRARWWRAAEGLERRAAVGARWGQWGWRGLAGGAGAGLACATRHDAGCGYAGGGGKRGWVV